MSEAGRTMLQAMRECAALSLTGLDMVPTTPELPAWRSMWRVVERMTAERMTAGRCKSGVSSAEGARTERRGSPGGGRRKAFRNPCCRRAVSVTETYCRHDASEEKQMSHLK